MRSEEAGDAQVGAAIDALFDHLAAGRAAEALACFARASDVALYGSEEGEVLLDREAIGAFLTRLCAGGTGPRFVFPALRPARRGTVAWFTADGSVTVAGQTVAPYRLTGVLEERGGRWLWVLFNGSEPRPDRA